MTPEPQFTPCLLFVGEQCGRAEEAMRFHTSLFGNSRIIEIDRYAAREGADAEGTVKHATFSLNGQQFMAQDSGLQHNFTFTPAMSIFVNCETETEIAALFGKLSEGGQVLMPLANHPFSKKFGWLNDRFGVSWQLNLRHPE